MTGFETGITFLTAVYVGVTGYYAIVSHKTLKAIEKQAKLTEDQATSNSAQFTQELAAMSESRKQTAELIEHSGHQAQALLSAAEFASIHAAATQLLVRATTDNVEFSRLNSESAKDNAIAAKASADTALLHAQAIINSERPWLFITINKPVQIPWQTNVVFTATNQGRTPAEVIMWQVEWAYRESEHKWEQTPSYSMQGSEFVYKKYLAKGDAFEVFEFNCRDIFNDDSWQEHLKTRRRLTFYGHVVYRDLITRDEHETRFCYWLSPAEWVGLIAGGPSEYHKHT